MKKLYAVLTLILLFSTTSIFAQDFAPVGAKWVYTVDFSSSPNIGYETIESISDTVIQGKTCQKVVAPEGHQELSGGTKFLHTNNDTLFIYDTTTQAFSPFQIFNAQAGDEWDFVYTPASLGMTPSIDTLHYIVDSVGIEIINTDTLKKVYASSILSCAGWSIEDTTKIVYLERLGDLYYLFNYNNYSCNPAIDADIIGGLRCYSDPDFGSYETGIVDSCYWIYDPTSVAEINNENSLKLWPNPANNELNIQLTSTVYELSIYNINGQLVKQINVFPTQHQSLTIDVADLPTGIYSLVGVTNHETIKVKFMKQ